jgi:hypothetical protein
VGGGFGWLGDCDVVVQETGKGVTEDVFSCRSLSFL